MFQLFNEDTAKFLEIMVEVSKKSKILLVISSFKNSSAIFNLVLGYPHPPFHSTLLIPPFFSSPPLLLLFQGGKLMGTITNPPAGDILQAAIMAITPPSPSS